MVGTFPGDAIAFIVFMCDLCPAFDPFFFFGMLFCACMPFLRNCLCFWQCGPPSGGVIGVWSGNFAEPLSHGSYNLIRSIVWDKRGLNCLCLLRRQHERGNSVSAIIRHIVGGCSDSPFGQQHEIKGFITFCFLYCSPRF